MNNIDSLSYEEYIRYLEKAEYLHEKGLHLDKSVIQLANMIYINDEKNRIDSGG
jgi:hypothetical protein